MNTNDANNPMNSGTGAGANYGTSNTGTGLGNSGLTSNESTSYNAGTDYSSATGGSTSSDANTLDSSTGSPLSTTSPTTPTNAADADSRPGDDYSATAKGAAVAGTAGAAVGRGIDAVQNTASRAGHAVADAVTGDNDSYDNGYREGSTTSGIFRDRSSAEKAYQSLHERGYSKDDVHLMMSDETRDRHFADNGEHTDLGDKAMEGAGVGSAIGGTAGAIIGAIAAIGTSVALPGLGLIIAGPLAAALAGAGAGGLTGGLVGALVGSGIPEEHAAEYEEGIKNGGIVMGVKPRNAEDSKYFEEQFKSNDADKVYRY
jgi:hypothetical protein